MENNLDSKMLAEKAYRLGFEYEKTHMGCSQCALAAMQDTFGIRNDDVFKASTGLAGGVGGLCNAGCGAYSAGALFLSGLYGRDRKNFAEPLGKDSLAMGLIGKLHNRFIKEYGTVICRDIQMKLFGRYYYLQDDDEWAKFEKDRGHDEVCPGVVGRAARWVVEVLDEGGLLPGGFESSYETRGNDMKIEMKIEEMGFKLPAAVTPVANYVPAVRTGNLIFLSGHGPSRSDGTLIRGKLGADLNVEAGYEASRQVALVLLASLKAEIGDLDKVRRMVKLLGMVNCTPDFVDQAKVINGASDFLVEVFGEKGKHARSAVGMSALPMNMAVEIEMVVEVEG